MRSQNIDLPVVRTTEYLKVREAEGRQVFTYEDLAEGFKVEPARIRQAFSRNSGAWACAETDVYQIDTGAGQREARWFTARGAMRFCRYVKSGRADALYNHLLDLWEAERAAGTAPASRDAVTEVDRLAGMMGQFLPAFAGKVADMDTRIAKVEEVQRITDPREIERRMRYLDTCKSLLVFGTKGRPQAVTFAGYWRTLKDLIGIASFQNRAALTVPMMDKCVAYAREWCETRGVNPPTLFDEKTA